MEQPIPKDLTFNVRELIDDAVTRIDDLRDAETKRIDEKFKDADVKYQIQFTGAKEAVAIASTAQEKLVAQALDGTKEAITKADVATDKRFELLSDQIRALSEILNKNTGAQGIYVTHTDLSAEMEKLRLSFENMLRPVKTFMDNQQGKSSGLNAGWIYLLGGVSFISTIIAIFIALSK